jgi:hypothetical protein
MIRVISTQRMEFAKPPPALVLRYQSDLNIDEEEKLQQEVSEIWSDFQKDAEEAHLDAAAIIANEVPTGWPIYHSRTFGFVFQKAPDGSWKQTRDK